MSEEPRESVGVRVNLTRTHPHNTVMTPTSDGTCSLDAEGYCITCSDEAVQVHVLSVNQESGLALVAIDDAPEEIDVTLVEHVEPGDILLVHGGVAIARVDEASNG
jgi:hydrogenase maturation factor